MNDLEAKRLANLEDRVSQLEHKVAGISAPLLDAIENFRHDTLSLFEGLALRLEARIEAAETRTSKQLDRLDRKLDELPRHPK